MESRRLDIRFKDFEIAQLKHEASKINQRFSNYIRGKLGLQDADIGGRPPKKLKPQSK